MTTNVLNCSYNLRVNGKGLIFLKICLFDVEERAGCFAFIVFWMSCYCKAPVSHPHGAVAGSAACDCGVS